MSGVSFEVGDRVRVCACAILRVGMLGTIIGRLLEGGIYDVRFDADGNARLMWVRELEHADRPTDAELHDGDPRA